MRTFEALFEYKVAVYLLPLQLLILVGKKQFSKRAVLLRNTLSSKESVAAVVAAAGVVGEPQGPSAALNLW